MRKNQTHLGREVRPSSTALAMGPVHRMNLVDVQRCRDAAARDILVGALTPKRANALFRQLGQRVREIRRPIDMPTDLDRPSV